MVSPQSVSPVLAKESHYGRDSPVELVKHFGLKDEVRRGGGLSTKGTKGHEGWRSANGESFPKTHQLPAANHL